MKKNIILLLIAITSTLTAQTTSWDSWPSQQVSYHHEYKSASYKKWYHNIGITLFEFGRGAIEEVEVPNYKYDRLKSTTTKTLGYCFNVSYDFMRKLGPLYIGPGVTLGGCTYGFTPGAYVKAFVELMDSWNAVRPYLTFSYGVASYGGMDIATDYNVYYNYLSKQYTGYYGHKLSGADSMTTTGKGLKKYLNFGVGMIGDVGLNGIQMALGYQATLRPSSSSYINIGDYNTELKKLSSAHKDGSTILSRNIEDGLRLYHGMYLSVMF